MKLLNRPAFVSCALCPAYVSVIPSPLSALQQLSRRRSVNGFSLFLGENGVAYALCMQYARVPYGTTPLQLSRIACSVGA